MLTEKMQPPFIERLFADMDYTHSDGKSIFTAENITEDRKHSVHKELSVLKQPLQHRLPAVPSSKLEDSRGECQQELSSEHSSAQTESIWHGEPRPELETEDYTQGDTSQYLQPRPFQGNQLEASHRTSVNTFYFFPSTVKLAAEAGSLRTPWECLLAV